MTWQEVIFSVGNVGFALTLIPTMLNPQAQVPRTTSVPIAVILVLYVVAFASLAMPVAAFFVAATVGCWGFIAWKRATPA